MDATCLSSMRIMFTYVAVVDSVCNTHMPMAGTAGYPRARTLNARISSPHCYPRSFVRSHFLEVFVLQL
jgi:hypothetical protein